MFTGIVEAVGQVLCIERCNGDMRVKIATGDLDLSDVALGDSIATNGVCLTVTDLPGSSYWADVSVATLSHSTLGGLAVGEAVNLEKALALTARLGGHLVSGHVDGVGEVLTIHPTARSVRVQIRMPANISRYVAPKGSICVDGVSLTVNEVDNDVFWLNVVPFTMEKTILSQYRVGRHVNLEVDIIARYLERLLLSPQDSEKEERSITKSFLAEHGFLARTEYN